MMAKSDELHYCNKNVATPGLPTLLCQLKVRTNLEVLMLYTQVKVMVLPFFMVKLVRDHWGFQDRLLWS